MSYTPKGPWTIEEYGDDDRPALVIHKDTENRVCFMATPGSGDPAHIEADARLIAAAPDLLDLLCASRQCVWEICGNFGLLEKIDAAIAKADGRP